MSDKTIIRTDFSDEGPLPPGLGVELAVLAGPLQGKTYKLYKRNTILGRSAGDIILKDPAVSKEHAELAYEDGRMLVRDLNSSNGTKLNGGQVFEALLNSGDEIVMGGTVIRIDIKQTAASASWANMGMDAAADSAPVDNEITEPIPEKHGNSVLDSPLPEGVKGGLQVISGVDDGLKFVIKKRGTTIGRAGDVVLHDLTVSRKHAAIEFMGPDRVILKDLRSNNGTYLNTKWTSIGNLNNGDMIQIGNTVIKFYLANK